MTSVGRAGGQAGEGASPSELFEALGTNAAVAGGALVAAASAVLVRTQIGAGPPAGLAPAVVGRAAEVLVVEGVAVGSFGASVRAGGGTLPRPWIDAKRELVAGDWVAAALAPFAGLSIRQGRLT